MEAQILKAVSKSWAKVELLSAACLALAITILILLNVVTRTLGIAIFWVDELAIYAMVWMTFLGASAAIHYGHAVKITILTDILPHNIRLLTAKIVDVIVVIFALFMVWFCYQWFSPYQLFVAGFDVAAFQSSTFNFVYAEPTTTLGIQKYWVWFVMWLFAIGACLHSFANLLDKPNIAPNKDKPK